MYVSQLKCIMEIIQILIYVDEGVHGDDTIVIRVKESPGFQNWNTM